MNPKIFLFIAAIVLLVIAVMAFFSNVTTGDATGVLNSSAAKLRAIAQYDLSYNISNLVTMGSESLDVQGTMRLVHSPTGDRMLYRAQINNSVTVSDMYILPNGTFMCTPSLSGMVCQRVDEIGVASPVDQALQLYEFSKTGFINFTSAGTRTIMGRQADCVVSKYDIVRMAENLSLPVGSVSGVKDMVSTQCFDAETGIPLNIDISLSVEQEKTAAVSVRMVATSLLLAAENVSLPDDAVIYSDA